MSKLFRPSVRQKPTKSFVIAATVEPVERPTGIVKDDDIALRRKAVRDLGVPIVHVCSEVIEEQKGRRSALSKAPVRDPGISCLNELGGGSFVHMLGHRWTSLIAADKRVFSALPYSNDALVSFPETSQSLAAAVASRAWGMISAAAGLPRSSPNPPGP